MTLNLKELVLAAIIISVILGVFTSWVLFAVVLLLFFAIIFYACLYPTSQLFGSALCHLDTNDPLLALTFDDGPDPNYTPAILDILQQHQVKATFFFVGKKAAQYPEIVRRASQEGHSIGNHSWSHSALIGRTTQYIGQELEKTQAVLTNLVEKTPVLFRASYGLRDPLLLHEVARHNLIPVQWSITAFDWICLGDAKILNRVVKSLHPGGIILLHDGAEKTKHTDRSQTLSVVDQLIPIAQQKGYQFVPITQNL